MDLNTEECTAAQAAQKAWCIACRTTADVGDNHHPDSVVGTCDAPDCGLTIWRPGDEALANLPAYCTECVLIIGEERARKDPGGLIAASHETHQHMVELHTQQSPAAIIQKIVDALTGDDSAVQLRSIEAMGKENAAAAIDHLLAAKPCGDDLTQELRDYMGAGMDCVASLSLVGLKAAQQEGQPLAGLTEAQRIAVGRIVTMALDKGRAAYGLPVR